MNISRLRSLSLIKFYSNETLVEGINLALKHRLYISGWCLSEDLTRARKEANRLEHKDFFSLALYFKNDVPIALCFRQGRGLQAFCKKSERKKGYAAKCVQHMKKHVEFALKAGSGVEGSLTFWAKMDVQAY